MTTLTALRATLLVGASIAVGAAHAQTQGNQEQTDQAQENQTQREQNTAQQTQGNEQDRSQGSQDDTQTDRQAQGGESGANEDDANPTREQQAVSAQGAKDARDDQQTGAGTRRNVERPTDQVVTNRDVVERARRERAEALRQQKQRAQQSSQRQAQGRQQAQGQRPMQQPRAAQRVVGLDIEEFAQNIYERAYRQGYVRGTIDARRSMISSLQQAAQQRQQQSGRRQQDQQQSRRNQRRIQPRQLDQSRMPQSELPAVPRPGTTTGAGNQRGIVLMLPPGMTMEQFARMLERRQSN